MQVYNQVRDESWFGVYTTYQDKVVKIWAGRVHHHCKNAIEQLRDIKKMVRSAKIFKDAIGV